MFNISSKIVKIRVNDLNIDIFQFRDDLHTKFYILEILFKITAKIMKIAAI